MVLNILAGLIYDIVQNSWLVATVLLKYILVLHIAKAYFDGRFNLKHLDEVIIEYSRPVVAGIVVLGVISTATGFTVEPRFELFSQLVALIYFGILFWTF